MSDISYNLQAGRTPEQLEQMKRLQESGICAFCPEYLATEHREPIEIRTNYWVVTKNDYPYKRTKLHLLLIPLKHVKTLSELNSEALHDLTDTIVMIEKKWGLKSYAVISRSGDMRYNGGSVEHLHTHIVVGDVDDPDPEPVRFKVSSRPKT